MYSKVLRDARFCELLMRIDQDLAVEVQADGCPHCGGPLHAGHFARKPRGILVRAEDLPEGYEVRFDFCCGHCRRRTLPESVRFLARRVYVGVVVAVVTVVARGLDRAALRRLQRELGVSRATVTRWGEWWRELARSAFWQRIGGSVPPGIDASELPASVLTCFVGDPAQRLLQLLRLLLPITSGSQSRLRGDDERQATPRRGRSQSRSMKAAMS